MEIVRPRPSSVKTQLFLLGFLTLFLELALIRYLPGNIWNLGYFPNLVLMSVFLGMGIGFTIQSKISERANPIVFGLGVLLLLGLIFFVDKFHPKVPGFSSWNSEFGGELYFTDTSVKTNGTEEGSENLSYLHFGIVFLTLTFIFACISQQTAKVFRKLQPLTAYSLDILGSIAGILVFMAISFFTLPAYGWFAIVTLLFLATASRRILSQGGILVAGALIVFVVHGQDKRLESDHEFDGTLKVEWSPYQKVEFASTEDGPRRIFVNGLNHQRMYSDYKIRNSFYQVPHDDRAKAEKAKPYKNVLIIGSGSGNDIASALINGAEHIDAVEIDPVIAALGKTYHPMQPYSDPKVRLIVDDGRSFMTKTKQKYDLIIFALTDSVVKVSAMSQLRLENFLFTKDSVERASQLLTEDGDIVLYNYYRTDWLVEKIRNMIFAATNKWPRQIYQREDFVVLKVGKNSFETTGSPSTLSVPSDNWPFLYLKTHSIPSIYLWALLGMSVILLGLFTLFQRIRLNAAFANPPGTNHYRIAFGFMGAAFLLLQTKSVIQFSLLFGTTWINNSLVFLAVLVFILAANWTATLFKSTRGLHWIFVALILSSLLSLLVPLNQFLEIESKLLRFVAASLFTFCPIFLANLAFSITFREQEIPEHMFGWNLLGATIGGLLEYSSMVLGYNGISVLVAICYGIVYAAIFVARRLKVAPEFPNVQSIAGRG